MARIGTNMTVQVESTTAVAYTNISAITQADPGEVTTATAHGFTTGDVLKFAASAGMVELDGQLGRITTTATDVFTIDSLDTTDYSVFTAGSYEEITAWHTLSNAQSASMPDGTPEKIDITTLIDKSKQYAYGLADAPDGSIAGLYDPANAGVIAIKAASKSNTALGFQIIWAGGQYTMFNANVSGGSGFELAQNDAAKSTISFTPVKDVLDYAS
jgi:hypothetical protein